MSAVAASIVGGALVVGGAVSANAQRKAAQGAANAQTEASRNEIAERARQFDAAKELMSPFVQAGTGALGAQQELLGLSGADKQQQAISALEQSPQFASLMRQGETAILQNASATGGLRGGNTQSALMQFRPDLLSSLINDQYAKLGGLTSMGQNAAAFTGNAGMQTGAGIGQAYQNIGAAQAGAAMARGQATSGLVNSLTGAVGAFGGLGGFGSANTGNFQSMFGRF